jgi:hypothetical protein
MKKDNELRAARLRQSRIRAGFEDAAKAAERFGWSVITYRSHENAIRGIKPDVGKAYAKAFKTSFSWLMTGEGAPSGPGIDAELLELPPDVSESVIKDIRALIHAAKIKARIPKP